MCERQCALCDNTIHSGSTHVNVVCDVCATTHQLCVNCGGDIDCREKRRKFGDLTPTAAEQQMTSCLSV
jgi:hypothetical protein